MLKQKKKIIGISILAVTLLMNITAVFLLPKDLVMQITFNGEQGTTMQTPVGLLLLTAMIVYLDFRFFKGDKESGEIKWLVLSLFILALNIATVVFNFLR